MARGTITVKILGDAKNAIAALRETEGAADKFKLGLATVGPAVAAGALAAGAALFAIGNEFDGASDAIRTATGATGEALAGLETSFDNVVSSVPANFDDAAAAIGTVAQKLNLTGADLEGVSTQFLNLSRITGTDLASNMESGTQALQNFGVAAGDQESALDVIFRASQETGVSFDTLAAQLATGGVALREFGFGFEESAALLASFSESGIDADTAIAGLRKGLGNVAKDGEAPAEALARVVEGIESAGSSSEATALAMELFGAKAGPEMAAAIRSGTFELDELTKAISNGDTINQAAEDTADFAEQWQLFKNQTLVALKPLALAVFGAIGTAMTTLGPLIKPIIDGIVGFVQFLADNIEYVVAVAAGIAVALLPAGIAIAATLVPAFIAWAVSAGAAAIATITAAAPVIAIGVAVAALAAGIIWAYKNVDFFRTAVDAVAGFLTGTLWPALKQVAGFITGGLVPAVVSVVGWFVDMGVKAATLATDVYSMAEDIVGFIVGMPDRIRSAASGMFDGIKDAFRSAINFIIDKWNSLSFSLPSVDTPFGNIGGFSLDTPNIQKFHSGGVVPGRYGQEVLILAEAGETVRTVEQERALGRGGVNIENLYVTERNLLEELTELEARYGVAV